MPALDGKSAWVTGAGTGIGRAVALALAREGAKVGLSGRTRGTLDETAAAIRAEGGICTIALCDVGAPEQVDRAWNAVVAEFGEIDILVNNAGWNTPQRAWKQLTPQIVQQMVGANLTGPFLCTMKVLPGMRAKGGGMVFNIASLAATGIFMVSGVSYTATKHAARAMSLSLNAEEGIHGVRAVCINPGEVETPIMDKRPLPPSAEARALMVQPEDVAAAVLFCAALPPRSCVSELTLVPTDNNFYRADAKAIAARA
jgi:NAD(P)-dependent dehydrogenase (short-subunit alcohol dehydrogenase family)